MSKKKEQSAPQGSKMPATVPPNLTEELLVEYKEAFDLLITEDNPTIAITAVPDLMRKIGLMPSNEEIENIINEMDTEGTIAYEGINFEQFCQIANRKIKDVYGEEDIINAFNVFDVDSNASISVTELKRVLQGQGEALTDEEMNALINFAKPDESGNIKYEEFVKEVMGEL